MLKPTQIHHYQIRLPLPSVKKNASKLRGSYISHHMLEDIEKRTTYYSSLCSSFALAPQKNYINLKNLQSRLPKLETKKKKKQCQIRIKDHAKTYSNMMILAKNNLIESETFLFNKR